MLIETLGWFAIVVAAVYIIIGQKFILDASRHLKNPRRTYYYTPLLSPEEFTPEGEFWRRRAIRYWYGGAAVVVVILLSVMLLQRM